MSKSTARRFAVVALAAGFAFGCGSSAKPAAKPVTTGTDVLPAAGVAAALPAAGEVLERYIEVTGGRAAYEKVTTTVVTGVMSMPAMNLSGPVVVYAATPRKLYMTVNIPGVADQERGTDGELAWEKATMTGNRIIEGKELAAMMREATFNADLYWKDLYSKVETVELAEVDGKAAYKLVLTTPEETSQTRYYDQATGLLLRTEMVADTNMGSIPVEIMVADYRDVEGIKVPFKNVSKMMGMEQVLTIEKIEVNVAIPAERFAIPAEIEALRAAAKPGAADGTPRRGADPLGLPGR